MIERLSQFIQNQGVSVRAFEGSISASDGMIRRAINNGTDIQSKWLAAIADNYPNINIEWLVTGRGEMLKKPKLDEKTAILVPITTTTNKSMVKIPVVDISVAAGSGFSNVDYVEEVDSIAMPSSMIKNGKEYLCVRVKGDSMNPSILNDGYLVIRLLDRSEWGDIKNHYVYVVSDKNGNAYVKRLKNRLREYGFIVCTSDNPTKHLYPNFNIYEEDLNTIWYAEWYFSARIPNIQEQFYSKQSEFEDRIEALEASVFQKALQSKNQ